MKTPAGRIFYDHFNENLFRSDTGIERTQLGSLLDHMGAIGKVCPYELYIIWCPLTMFFRVPITPSLSWFLSRIWAATSDKCRVSNAY